MQMSRKITHKTLDGKVVFYLQFNSIQHLFINTYAFFNKYCLKISITESTKLSRGCEILLGGANSNLKQRLRRVNINIRNSRDVRLSGLCGEVREFPVNLRRVETYLLDELCTL